MVPCVRVLVRQEVRDCAPAARLDAFPAMIDKHIPCRPEAFFPSRTKVFAEELRIAALEQQASRRDYYQVFFFTVHSECAGPGGLLASVQQLVHRPSRRVSLLLSSYSR